jgi:hypothetical protein
MSSFRNLTIDAIAAEAPQHNGLYLYKGKTVLIDADLPYDFPYLRMMKFEALYALFNDPQYDPRVISHLLTKPEDLQRHVLLNCVNVQTVEAVRTCLHFENSLSQSLLVGGISFNKVEYFTSTSLRFLCLSSSHYLPRFFVKEVCDKVTYRIFCPSTIFLR